MSKAQDVHVAVNSSRPVQPLFRIIDAPEFEGLPQGLLYRVLASHVDEQDDEFGYSLRISAVEFIGLPEQRDILSRFHGTDNIDSPMLFRLHDLTIFLEAGSKMGDRVLEEEDIFNQIRTHRDILKKSFLSHQLQSLFAASMRRPDDDDDTWLQRLARDCCLRGDYASMSSLMLRHWL